MNAQIGGTIVKTILIVDDDIAVRTMMKIVLDSEGYRVLEAENGMTAFTLAMENHPDLVISDVMMENLNGFMLYEMLQGEPSTRTIPVILITGAAQGFGAWGSEERVGYLQKPVSMQKLLSDVKKRLHTTPAGDRGRPHSG